MFWNKINFWFFYPQRDQTRFGRGRPTNIGWRPVWKKCVNLRKVERGTRLGWLARWFYAVKMQKAIFFVLLTAATVRWVLRAPTWKDAAAAAKYEGAGAVLTFQDVVVLGINRDGELAAPGGKVDMGEKDPLITAMREVLEETGLRFDPSRFKRLDRELGPGSTGYNQIIYMVELTREELDYLLQAKAPIGDGTMSGFVMLPRCYTWASVIYKGVIYSIRPNTVKIMRLIQM